jgi:Helix-turn-helix domain
MKYLNATQAANRLGISDKTMRRWLKEEKYDLHAVRTPSHELMIAEDEIDRVKRERAEYADDRSQETTDAPGSARAGESALSGRVEDLERQLEELRTEIRQITRQGHEDALTEETLWSTSTIQQKPARPTKSALPENAILARKFADLYGVSPGTFRGHYELGLGSEREKAPISSRADPARTDGKMQWYVLPEQSGQVLDYWRRNRIKFHDPVMQAESKEG